MKRSERLAGAAIPIGCRSRLEDRIVVQRDERIHVRARVAPAQQRLRVSFRGHETDLYR